MAKPVKIFGHRGCRGKKNPPENTLAAFQEAIDQGADGIELDVFLTKDNELVVFHDDTLGRMTGVKGNIIDRDLDELKKLEVWDRDLLSEAEARRRFGKKPERIPTLHEVLDLVEDFRLKNPRLKRAKDFVVNIEIKEMKGKNIADPVARVVNDRVDLHGWDYSNFQVSSFDMESLRKIKKADADIPRGALFAGSRENKLNIDADVLKQRLKEAKGIEPQTVNLTLPSLTPEAIQLIRDIGAEPAAWTFKEIDPDNQQKSDRREVVRQLKENGIGVLMTDYPRQRLADLGRSRSRV